MALEVKRFGRVREVMAPPNLMKLQVESYSRFLQPNLPPDEREPMGLEGILSEIFPIESYDKSLSLEYLGYDLGRPRYSTDDCRKLRKTYGMPFKIRVRLVKGSEAKEEDVYLGEIPMMIGGGEFIVNGSERVIVSQLHRSPGVDFDKEIHTSDKVLHKCRVIPERGSWIEINVSKRDALTVRIDQSGKFPVTCLVRALFPEYATNEDIIRLFYKTKRVKMSTKSAVSQIAGKVGVSDIVDETTGEIKAEGGMEISERLAEEIKESGVAEIEVIQEVNDWLILNTLKEDSTRANEDALLDIYRRLRPGNPPQLEKARALIKDKFFNDQKYRLGKVGRFRINRKFGLDLPDEHQTLTKDDFIHAIRYILKLRDPNDAAELDDIDHLGNRRIRTIDELAGDEFRKGFLKLEADGPGAHDDPRAGEDLAAHDHQLEDDLELDRLLLRPRRAVAGRRPDQPAVAADARASSVGAGPRRSEPEAGELRGARRAHLALRPDLPDRDAGGHEHRSDRVAVDLRDDR